MLATTGTLQGGRFRERLQESGIETLTPAGPDQERVMVSIYEIKGAPGGAEPERDRSRDPGDCRPADPAAGAQGVVAGCTEIPLVLKPGDLDVPVFDTLLLLARAAVAAAGRTPL